MLALGRLFAVVSCILVAGGAQAQTLPAEQALNSRGLTRAGGDGPTSIRRRTPSSSCPPTKQSCTSSRKPAALTAFDAETGKRLWIRQLGPTVQAGFRANSNDTEVLISAGMVLFSLDKLTGKTNWTLDLPHHLFGPRRGRQQRLRADERLQRLPVRSADDPQAERRRHAAAVVAPRPRMAIPDFAAGPLPALVRQHTRHFRQLQRDAVRRQRPGVKLKFQFEAGSPVTTPSPIAGTPSTSATSRVRSTASPR